MNEEKKIILFDGVCNLCNSCVRFIIKHDKRNQFLFGSLQGKAGQDYLQKFNLNATVFNSFILIENDKVFTRSKAVLQVVKHLGGIWKLLYVFIILPKFIRDRMYDFVAKNRYKWFGKKEECLMPAAGLQSRFLD